MTMPERKATAEGVTAERKAAAIRKRKIIPYSGGMPFDQSHLCRNCEESYDWHEKSVNGDVFMCRCPHHKAARFLNHDGCDDKFKPRR